MGTHTPLREGTGSKFMTPGAATIQYPTTGQGGVTATASSSGCVNASAANPVIIDAIKVGTVATNPVLINIRNAGDSATLFSATFPVSTSSSIITFGPLGIVVEQNWGTTYSGGTPTDIQVLYRYGV